MEIPPHETGAVPVSFFRADARVYGVPPALLVFVLAVAVATVAVALVATGHWPLALVLAGVAILLLLIVAGEVARTRARRSAGSSVDAVEAFRARTSVAAESVATRGRATRRLFVLRRELRRLGALRAQLLFELGDAVYRDDREAADAARARVAELDRFAAEREAEMYAVVDAAQQRIERGRLAVQPTQIVAETQPEPGQPPGEANPPEPARIPEQYPPPDEGTPPQPAVIPEPGPAVIPEPGPQGEAAG
jgi:hypothetical protein